MLADAGVELGVTYPFPVISLEESEEHLQMAAQVIQDTLAASMAEPQVLPPLPLLRAKIDGHCPN